MKDEEGEGEEERERMETGSPQDVATDNLFGGEIDVSS